MEKPSISWLMRKGKQSIGKPGRVKKKLSMTILIVDVRDAWSIRETGTIFGAVVVSVVMLAVRELPENNRDLRLQDRSRHYYDL